MCDKVFYIYEELLQINKKKMNKHQHRKMPMDMSKNLQKNTYVGPISMEKSQPQ